MWHDSGRAAFGLLSGGVAAGVEMDTGRAGGKGGDDDDARGLEEEAGFAGACDGVDREQECLHVQN